jgi:hypothetical protein
MFAGTRGRRKKFKLISFVQVQKEEEESLRMKLIVKKSQESVCIVKSVSPS